MSKYCIFCNSTSIIKKGKQSNRQKYYCKTCFKWFQSNKQPNRKTNLIINQLTFKKTIQIQNLKQEKLGEYLMSTNL